MRHSDYLIHYGVLGMRWGYRKNNRISKKASKSKKSSSSTKKKKTSYKHSEDAKEVKALRKKPVSALSNDDLRKINKRLNLEREYRSLRQDELNRGKKDFEQVLNYGDTANRTMSMVTRTMSNIDRLKKLAA